MRRRIINFLICRCKFYHECGEDCVTCNDGGGRYCGKFRIRINLLKQ